MGHLVEKEQVEVVGTEVISEGLGNQAIYILLHQRRVAEAQSM